MKIITPGNLPVSAPYRTICRKCGTVFEFLRHEAKLSYSHRDRDYLTVLCPLQGCKKEVMVMVHTSTAVVDAAIEASKHVKD